MWQPQKCVQIRSHTTCRRLRAHWNVCDYSSGEVSRDFVARVPFQMRFRIRTHEFLAVLPQMHHVHYHEVQAQHLSHTCSCAVCLQYAHDARTKELSDHRGYRWTCKTLDVPSSIVNTKSATFYSSYLDERNHV